MKQANYEIKFYSLIFLTFCFKKMSEESEKSIANELKDIKAALKTKTRFQRGAQKLLKLLKEDLTATNSKSIYHALDTLSHNCTKDGKILKTLKNQNQKSINFEFKKKYMRMN